MITEHKLRWYGAAHDEHGVLLEDARGGVGRVRTGGVGRAVCSCGAVSGVLGSGLARRAWHAEHRPTMGEAWPIPEIEPAKPGWQARLVLPSMFARHFWRVLLLEPALKIRDAGYPGEVELDWSAPRMVLTAWSEDPGVLGSYLTEVGYLLEHCAGVEVPHWELLSVEGEELATPGKESIRRRRMFYRGVVGAYLRGFTFSAE